MLLELPLLNYQSQLQLKVSKGKRYIFDLIRKKYLVLTPEEIVRQLIILYLIEEKNYPKNKIRVEMGLTVNELTKRCDILIFNKNFEPVLLVECKAATVKINQKVFEQIATYNMTLQVPYLLVTNGPQNYCSFIDHERQRFDFLKEIPDYNTIKE